MLDSWRCLGLAGSLALSLAAFAQAQPPSGAPAVKAIVVKLRAHLLSLTAPQMEGRGPGSAGLEEARDYIEQSFAEIGLTPGAGEKYSARFTPSRAEVSDAVTPAKGEWGSIELANVIGLLRGSDPAAGAIVISAHYDHLGKNAAGELFAGADDNASGVAALIELARRLKAEPSLRRTIVFLATSGEEEGLLGAKAYVASPAVPLDHSFANLNLDTIGRMEERKLYLFGAASAAEWPEILRGVNLGYGLELVTPMAAPFASDQAAFFEKGIPVLHFFTGPNLDYHRPTDTAEKVNVEGLVEVIDFASDLAIFLADREEPLTFVPPGAANAKPQTSSGGPRKVSLGTIPDFARESGGVLLSGVTPGSPAEKAGFQKGDVLVDLGGTPIDNLSDFTDALKGHQPGDEVAVTVKRGAESITKTVTLVERK